MSAPPVDERSGARPGVQRAWAEPTAPRQAATVILLRGGADGLELLLVKRNPQARFMGGVWVFPGGAVEQTRARTTAPIAPRRCASCARRPASSCADPAELVKFSRWITPAVVRTRFDTHFFLASLPDGQEPHVDGEECVDLGWYTPGGALDAHRAGEIVLVFPTIKHLEQLAPFATAGELLEYARGREVQAVSRRSSSMARSRACCCRRARVLTIGSSGRRGPLLRAPSAAAPRSRG